MGEGQNNSGFSFEKGSTSVLKGIDPNGIGNTGVLGGGRTGETGVLKGSIAPNVYNTTYNYEQSHPAKNESKAGKIVFTLLMVAFVVIAVVAALNLFGVF